jgi:hypothetical protein
MEVPDCAGTSRRGRLAARQGGQQQIYGPTEVDRGRVGAERQVKAPLSTVVLGLCLPVATRAQPGKLPEQAGINKCFIYDLICGPEGGIFG